MLKITNSLTSAKEPFFSLTPGKVLLYVCGITPYSQSHIGHGRCYTSFDVLYRLLKFLGNDVRYCRNFTDVDDKLIYRALQEFGRKDAYHAIADREIQQYHHEMKLLGNLSPDIEPRVTNNISVIIEFIEQLIAKGSAYPKDGSVYFRVALAPGYPQLARHKLDDLRAGERIDVREDKEDPLDFALWKNEPEGGFWDSPWGNGRPGWHIECSALAGTYLGAHIDIHAGGMDLKFPHHDNEIAQSEAHYGAPFARYWVHNGLVRMGEEKMSKSLGNVFLLHNLFQEYDPMVIRFLFLMHHYGAPLEFSQPVLDMARKTYERLCRMFENTSNTISGVSGVSGISGVNTPGISNNLHSNIPVIASDIIRTSHDTISVITSDMVRTSPVASKMLEFLCDDLNTVGMLGVLFDQIGSITSQEEKNIVKLFLQQMLGLTLEPIAAKTVEITPEIQSLLDEREQARISKNWKRADEIRDQLQSMGVPIADAKTAKPGK